MKIDGLGSALQIEILTYSNQKELENATLVCKVWSLFAIEAAKQPVIPKLQKDLKVLIGLYRDLDVFQSILTGVNQFKPANLRQLQEEIKAIKQEISLSIPDFLFLASCLCSHGEHEKVLDLFEYADTNDQTLTIPQITQYLYLNSDLRMMHKFVSAILRFKSPSCAIKILSKLFYFLIATLRMEEACFVAKFLSDDPLVLDALARALPIQEAIPIAASIKDQKIKAASILSIYRKLELEQKKELAVEIANLMPNQITRAFILVDFLEELGSISMEEALPIRNLMEPNLREWCSYDVQIRKKSIELFLNDRGGIAKSLIPLIDIRLRPLVALDIARELILQGKTRAAKKIIENYHSYCLWDHEERVVSRTKLQFLSQLV